MVTEAVIAQVVQTSTDRVTKAAKSRVTRIEKEISESLGWCMIVRQQKV